MKKTTMRIVLNQKGFFENSNNAWKKGICKN